MIAGRFPLHAVRAILHASHFRTMTGERVYLATLGNGNVIAWAAPSVPRRCTCYVLPHADDCGALIGITLRGEAVYAEDEPDDQCTNAAGHEWVYTGTAYGGDDDRWMGEGRCYCKHCGADGDA